MNAQKFYALVRRLHGGFPLPFGKRGEGQGEGFRSAAPCFVQRLMRRHIIAPIAARA